MQNNDATRVTAREIQAFVCSKFCISHDAILGDLREKRFAVPRQLAMALCRILTNQTLGQIGEAFSRDHTTVLHAIRKWEGSPRLFDLEREFKAHKGHPPEPEIARGTTARLPPPIPSLGTAMSVPTPRPAEWNQMTSEQRLTAVLGMSIDRTRDMLAWDPNTCTPEQLRALSTVIGRVVSLLGKMGMQRLDHRHQSELLEKMANVFDQAAKEKP